MADCEFCEYFKKKLTEQKQPQESKAGTEEKKPVKPSEKAVSTAKKEDVQKPMTNPAPDQPGATEIKAATENDSLKKDCEILQQKIDSLTKEIDELKKKSNSQENK